MLKRIIMKNNIIKDYDQFKEVNETDMGLLRFVTGIAGDQLEKTIKQRVTSMVLEYMGIPGGDPNDPQGKGEWIREIFVKTVANVSLKEMDKIISGEIKYNNEEFWVEKLAKALKEHLVDTGPSSRQVVNFIGVTPDGFIGRLISNSWREYILNEKRLEQTLKALWRLVATQEFIPQQDANEIYDEAVSKLTPEQREKIEGSSWQYSTKQSDLLKRKGG
jgi:hypothetical protein